MYYIYTLILHETDKFPTHGMITYDNHDNRLTEELEHSNPIGIIAIWAERRPEINAAFLLVWGSLRLAPILSG